MAQRWYPVIDYMTCAECGTCVDFCPHHVYNKDKAPTPVVEHPEMCIDHCHGCGNRCPQGAITYVGEDSGWKPPHGTQNDEQSSCDCGTDKKVLHKKKLLIEYLYLDLNTCNRCIGTDAVLEQTMTVLRPALELAGYEIEYKKLEMTTEQIAQQYKFLSSPTIRMNGSDIFGKIKESECGCCGEIAGTDVDCRVFEWDGNQYEVPPIKVMADAILNAIFNTKNSIEDSYEMPENLKRFYEGKSKKEITCSCGCGGAC